LQPLLDLLGGGGSTSSGGSGAGEGSGGSGGPGGQIGPTTTPQTAWTPPGTPPLADAQAAALVTPEPELRSDNAQTNDYVPSDAELSTFHSAADGDNPLNGYVDGRDGLPSPSTDELIQWAAHKWGIPEDWVRAVMSVESYWHQSAMGDRESVPSSWYYQYPPQARIAGTSDVYTSMGIASIKWTPGGLHEGSEPLRWKSTAFNLDYYAAQIRYYYDGDCSWCGSGYSAGQQWASIGAWYAPKPWNGSGARSYVERVQDSLDSRTWEQPGF
jgi:hypothetical protein